MMWVDKRRCLGVTSSTKDGRWLSINGSWRGSWLNKYWEPLYLVLFQQQASMDMMRSSGSVIIFSPLRTIWKIFNSLKPVVKLWSCLLWSGVVWHFGKFSIKWSKILSVKAFPWSFSPYFSSVQTIESPNLRENDTSSELNWHFIKIERLLNYIISNVYLPQIHRTKRTTI